MAALLPLLFKMPVKRKENGPALFSVDSPVALEERELFTAEKCCHLEVVVAAQVASAGELKQIEGIQKIELSPGPFLARWRRKAPAVPESLHQAENIQQVQTAPPLFGFEIDEGKNEEAPSSEIIGR